MNSRTLSPNSQTLLELVRDLRFTNREQLTALMADKLKENGTEDALRRLVAGGYLSKNLRDAHSPRSLEGMSRKRVVYYLAEKGRTHFGFTERQRQVMNWKVAKLGVDMSDLSHEVGISWLQTLTLLGHRQELWDGFFKRGKHIAFKVDGKTHTPDALAVLTSEAGTYRRFVEFVNKARLSLSVRHAVRYDKAFEEDIIKGRVVWIAKTSAKIRTLRAAIREAVPEAGNRFLFTSQDKVPLDPKALLGPVFVDTDGKPTALIPSRKPDERVA